MVTSNCIRLAVLLLFVAATVACAGDTSRSVPTVQSGISVDDGRWIVTSAEGKIYEHYTDPPSHGLAQFRREPIGTEDGVNFDFGEPELRGRLYYGLIPDEGEIAHNGRHDS